MKKIVTRLMYELMYEEEGVGCYIQTEIPGDNNYYKIQTYFCDWSAVFKISLNDYKMAAEYFCSHHKLNGVIDIDFQLDDIVCFKLNDEVS